MPDFSHVYVEKAAFDYPLTRRILERFPRSRVITVAGYKSVFARPRQHFQTQKKSMKLILAVKKDRWLYPGSDYSQGFGYDNFFYSTLMLNCVYNCAYCYLQGMYPSANLVLFVNTPDYFESVRQEMAIRPNPAQPLYLCLSYDTDLLAFESVAGYCREWISFVREQPDLLVEIRTKSGAYRSIRDIPATDRLILAWTLSPSVVARRYEHGAPPPRQRFEAMKEAIADGWPTRLCFDPILAAPGWKDAYAALIDETFEQVDPAAIRDVTVGVFRMAAPYFDRIRKQRPDLDLMYVPYVKEEDAVSYSEAQRQEIEDYMMERLRPYFPPERIAVWT